MAFRRTTLLRMGGFDENLDVGPPLPGGGDLDVLRRALLQPGGVVYEPAVAVFHEHRTTMSGLHRQFRSWGKTWTVCLMRPRRYGGSSRLAATRQLLGWSTWQLGRLTNPHQKGRRLVLDELWGSVTGLIDGYRRSARRMDRRRRAARQQSGCRAVALIPWGDVFEDYLDGIGLVIDQFLTEMTGGWLFGYVDALRSRNIETVIVLVSSSVGRPIRRMHVPSGTAVWVVPSGPLHRLCRRVRHLPMAYTARQAVEAPSTALGAAAAMAAWAAGPWLATPVLRLVRILRRERCQALICQEYESARFDLCVASRSLHGCPVFATYQGGSHTRSLERPLRGIAVRRAAGLLIADAEETSRVERVHGARPAAVHGIANPVAVGPEPTEADKIHARRTLGIGVGDPVVLWYGRVERWTKGLDVLLDAWDLLRSSPTADNAVLMLVGGGPDATWLENRIESSPGHIEWMRSYVTDRRQLDVRLQAADVFVQPSRHEGFAVAPMEAMAASVPVVGSAAPGIRRLLADDAGVVVPVDDSHALAKAIELVLENPGLAADLGRRGRTRVSTEFSPEAVGRQLENVLFAPAL